MHRLAGDLAILATNLLRPQLMLGVRLVAFNPAGEVFLVRHSYLPGWYLPGGAVDEGESAREAAIREAREEGGLILVRPPKLFNVYLNRATGRRDHVVLFVAHDVRQEADARPAWPEILEAGFFGLDALPPEATRATRARLGEVVNGALPGDLW